MLRGTNAPNVSGQHRWRTAGICWCRRTRAQHALPLTEISVGVSLRGVGTLHRERCLHVACAAAGRTGNDLPRDWTEVVAWARSEFRRCVGSPASLPDCRLHLSKACLLVALEEEAAGSGQAPHPELEELMREASGRLRPRSAAVASTWSGERLEALAAEVAALLDNELNHLNHQQEQDAGGGGGGAGGGGAAATVTAATAMTTATSTATPDSNAAAEPAAVASVSNSNSSTSSTSSFDFAAEQEQLLDRIHTSRPGAVGSCSGSTSNSNSCSSNSKGDQSSSSNSKGGGGEGGEGEGEQRCYYGSAWPSGRRVYGRRQALYRRYPVQTLAAVNTVLFDRHGYLPCNRYGVPSDHQLAAVLERGVGASAALSILYLEVCERLGFPLAARPLEDGRYFVLWPVEAPLTADGQRFLVDPYGRGGLLLLEEVVEIFGVEQPSALLTPASRRELLAALLGELRDAHWAAAAGCSPAPGSMTPLGVQTALDNKVVVPTSGVRAASLQRALAAAEKRLWLLPEDGEAQLHYGLLLYFSRRFDDAWIELSLYLERFAHASAGGGGLGAGGADGDTTAAAAVGGEAHSSASRDPSRDVGLDPEAVGADGGELGPRPASAPAEPGAVEHGLEPGGQWPAALAGAEAGEVVEGPSRGSGPQAAAEPGAEGMAPSEGAAPGVGAEGVCEEGAAVSGRGDAGVGEAGEAQGGSGPATTEAPAVPRVGASASVAPQVAVLVERIRLVLDFAPTSQ